MRQSRLSEEQIIGILREQEDGATTVDVRRSWMCGSTVQFRNIKRICHNARAALAKIKAE